MPVKREKSYLYFYVLYHTLAIIINFDQSLSKEEEGKRKCTC